MDNILIILSFILIILSLSSLIYRIKHLGVFIPALIGIIIIIVEIISKLCSNCFSPIFTIFEVSSLLFYIILFISILICNIAYPRPKISDFDTSTLVVLGCRVKNNKPSRMLKRRLEKALKILYAHNKLICIVSGGESKNTYISESHIMKQFLIDNGISSNRIFQENKSTNTFTNLNFSKKIIQENGFNKKMIILSDSYHLFRSYQYAKKLNIKCNCIACTTNILVWFSYMFRELIGICVYYIKYKK